jgi:putative Mn2+ efflux pump MntP
VVSVSFVFGVFGLAFFGYGVTTGSQFASGMRPYAAVIGGVLMVVAMVLTTWEKRSMTAEKRSRLSK